MNKEWVTKLQVSIGKPQSFQLEMQRKRGSPVLLLKFPPFCHSARENRVCSDFQLRRKRLEKLEEYMGLGHSKSLGISYVLPLWMSCAQYCECSALCEASKSFHNTEVHLLSNITFPCTSVLSGMPGQS